MNLKVEKLYNFDLCELCKLLYGTFWKYMSKRKRKWKNERKEPSNVETKFGPITCYMSQQP